MATATGKNVAYVVAAFVVIGCAVWLTWHQTETSWRSKWLARDAADLQAQLQSAQQAAATEHDWQRRYAATESKYQTALQAANDEADRNLDDYRRGIKRLRQSLSCTARNMPDTATAAGVRDAATGCGLQSRDVEFLIRYGKRAEATRQQLIGAQNILRDIYAHQPPAH